MNQEWIDEMIEKDKNGELEWDSLGCDGDTIHFDYVGKRYFFPIYEK